MRARFTDFITRTKPLVSLRNTRNLMAGGLTGMFFSLNDIFRVPRSSVTAGDFPSIFTGSMIALFSVLRMIKNFKSSFISPALAEQLTAEKEFFIRGSARLILDTIHTLEDQEAFFKTMRVNARDVELLASDDLTVQKDSLTKLYNGSSNTMEKYLTSFYKGSMHFFGYFSECMLAQVLISDTSASLFDYNNGFNAENILFWGVLVPFALVNGVIIAKETKQTYDTPADDYARQTIFVKLSEFKVAEPDSDISGAIQLTVIRVDEAPRSLRQSAAEIQ